MDLLLDHAILGFILGDSPSGEVNYELPIPCSLFLNILYYGLAVVSDDLARGRKRKEKEKIKH